MPLNPVDSSWPVLQDSQLTNADLVRIYGPNNPELIFANLAAISGFGQNLALLSRFGAVGDGVTNDTAAFQAAIDSIPQGGVIYGGGEFLIDQLTWNGNPYTVVINGGIILGDGAYYEILSGSKLMGVANAFSAQFGMEAGLCSVTPSPTSPRAILMHGASSGQSLEGVNIIEPTNVGLEISGVSTLTALITLRNVSCKAKPNTATSIPLLIDSVFWIDAEDIVFMGDAGGNPYPVQMLQTSPLTTYTGYVHFRRLRLNARGILLKPTTNNLTSDFVFEEPQLENGVDDSVAILTVDTSVASTYVTSIDISHPAILDGSGSVIRNIGSFAYGVNITGNNLNSSIINPAYSDPLPGLMYDGVRQFPYTNPWPEPSSSVFRDKNATLSGIIDATVVPAAHGQVIMPGTSIAFSQDPAAWVTSAGGVITTGKRAPDGSTMAGELSGPNNAAVDWDVAQVTSIDDWLIFGIYRKSTEDSKIIARCYGEIVGGTLDGSATLELTNSYIQGDDLCWKWICLAAKVTTGGTRIRMHVRKQIDEAVTNIFAPGCIYIPTGSGYSDSDIVNFARRLTEFPESTAQGMVSLLPHQSLYAGNSVQTASLALADVPAASATNVGQRWYVNDLNGAAYVYGAVAAAGGTRGGFVFSDGTNLLEG